MFHVKHSTQEAGSVSRETLVRLEIYADLLLKWNHRINLISRRTVADVWTRHFQDSLQLVPLMPTGVARGIDIGSGAGFPGLVLAVATGVPFDLVEADVRKAAFLREVAASIDAPVTIHAARIEDLALTACALVTARALAPLADLLVLAKPFIANGGVALFPKGARAGQELTDADAKWHMRVERHPSVTDPNGVILRLTEVKRA